MEGISDLAEGILNNAQSSWDGGVFGYLAKHVDLTNYQDLESPIKAHVNRVFASKGYLAAIITSSLWAALLIIIPMVLMILHCRRGDTARFFRTYQKMALRLQGSRHRLRTQTFFSGIYLIALCILVCFCCAAFIFAVAFDLRLHRVVISSEKHNSTTSFTTYSTKLPISSSSSSLAVIPKVRRAIDNVEEFLRQLVPHARTASLPVVMETIRKTAKMTEETINEFQAIFMSRLGVTKLFGLTQQLIERVSVNYDGYNKIAEIAESRFDHFTPIEYLMFKPRFLNQELNDLVGHMDKLLPFCGEMNKSVVCAEFKNRLLSTKLNDVLPSTDSTIIKIRDNGKSFINSLKAVRQTPTTIKLQMQEGEEKALLIILKLKQEFENELNSTSMILDMFNVQWDKADGMIKNQSIVLNRMSNKFEESSNQTVGKLESTRYAVFICFFILLALLLLFSLFVIFRTLLPIEGLDTRSRHVLKWCNFTLFLILSATLILTMGLFIISGYLETEVCRYLTQQATETNSNSRSNSPLVIDNAINEAISRNWLAVSQLLTKDNRSTSFVPPQPHDIIWGIRTSCQRNESLVNALNIFKQQNSSTVVDLSQIVDPRQLSGFLKQGRQLMLRGLRRIDPNSMMPPDLTTNLVNLKQGASFFIESNNYTKAERELRGAMEDEKVSTLNTYWMMVKQELINDKSNQLSINEINLIEQLTTGMQRATAVVQNFQNAINYIQNTLKQLRVNQEIGSLVDSILAQLDVVVGNIKNQSDVFALGNELYRDIVEVKTLEKTKELINFSVKNVLQVIGPCRNIYEAFHLITTAGCDNILRPFAGLYLTLGCIVFLFTPLLIFIRILLAKESDIDIQDGVAPVPETNGIVQSVINNENNNYKGISAEGDIEESEAQEMETEY